MKKEIGESVDRAERAESDRIAGAMGPSPVVKKKKPGGYPGRVSNISENGPGLVRMNNGNGNRLGGRKGRKFRQEKCRLRHEE
jgi:hypothetical protein